jgi:hypothetical protein
VPRYLSAQWLEALEAALRTATAAATRPAAPELSPASPPEHAARPVRAERLVIGQVVTAIPVGTGTDQPLGTALVVGEVRYTLAIGGGVPPEVRAGSLAGAQVVLVTDYDTARAIVAGEQTLTAALVAGRIKVRGDANALIAAQELLAPLGSALAELAEATQLD